MGTELQIQDSMQTFNTVVERCFSECVTSFRSKTLDKAEEDCVKRCVVKTKTFQDRVATRFTEPLYASRVVVDLQCLCHLLDCAAAELGCGAAGSAYCIRTLEARPAFCAPLARSGPLLQLAGPTCGLCPISGDLRQMGHSPRSY